MATSYDWPDPRCLIANENGLSINEATWQELRKVTVPVVVVGVVGLYRTGKSYLLNRLAKKQKGKDVPSQTSMAPNAAISR